MALKITKELAYPKPKPKTRNIKIKSIKSRKLTSQFSLIKENFSLKNILKENPKRILHNLLAPNKKYYAYVGKLLSPVLKEE